MEKRILGKTGMEVSVLGFGAAEIGYEGATQATVDRLMQEALDAGLNAVDTAECYLTSEEMLGQSVSHRRSEFFLFTKCGHEGTFYNPAWSKAEIKGSLERSLRRLKTDYVDLLQLHSCSKDVLEKGEVVEALLELKQAGKVRFIGYSGDGADARYAVEMNVFETLQTSLSIFDQECIDLTLPLAREKGMGVIAKRPIGNAVWRFPSRPDNSYVVEYWERMRALGYDFLDGSSESIGARALRFTYSVPGVHTMIVGTKVPGRWRSNALLLEKGPLSQEEMNAIREQWLQVSKGKNWVGQV
ncbi:MAG: aldo/keto reductase [Candidatus Obscuribacter phosphatis]|uniref:Aldo/keto reductase n=1 Tax=Candidatus Obscuribacter phosphatis TaxID=1906157 RepID=A0A8J7PAK6_9BACT|nr:aldo/keto reductase [Candidatus Obscuribacter phosphatis]